MEGESGKKQKYNSKEHSCNISGTYMKGFIRVNSQINVIFVKRLLAKEII